MKFIGKYGEHLVLTKLLEQDIEAYLAIKSNQENYDITAIIDNSRILRIQVKSTDLNNKATNNTISGIDKDYDYLVIVVIDKTSHPKIHVLTREEAITIKGNSKQLGITKILNRKFTIKDEITQHENKWEKLKSHNS